MAKQKQESPERFVVQDGEIEVLGRAMTDAEHADAQAQLQRGVPIEDVAAQQATRVMQERIDAGEFLDLFSDEVPNT